MNPGNDEDDRAPQDRPSSETPEDLAALEDDLSAYLKAQSVPSDAAIETAISLFDLSSVDDELADLVDMTAVATRGDGTRLLRFAGGGHEIVVVPAAGSLSVTVIPNPAGAVIEAEGRQVSLALDAAGGATVAVSGVVRIRVMRPEGADIVTGPIRVPAVD